MACIYRTKNETCTYFDQKKKMRHASWPKKEKKTRHAHILKLKFDTFIRAKYIYLNLKVINENVIFLQKQKWHTNLIF
jgi:hypothetical protein